MVVKDDLKFMHGETYGKPRDITPDAHHMHDINVKADHSNRARKILPR